MNLVSTTPATRPASARATRSGFYLGMSVAMLLIVFLGFFRTLYLRPLFDVPPISLALWLHGIAMTMWFVGAVVQASLVTVRRTDLHRALGWALVAVAVAVLVSAVAADLTFVPRRLAMGAPIEAVTGVVWSDRAALMWFTIFVGTAVAMRRSAQTHKRLMLLASISVLQPATSRIWRWPFFADLEMSPALLGLSALSALIVAMAINDVVTRGRVHPVTMIGGPLFIATKVVFVFVIARTAFGVQTVVGAGQ